MMLWLAIDTATDLGTAALGRPGSVLAEASFTDRQHGTSLMPSIQELLREARRDFDDVGGVVVADGPGSFTGLRIGLATAKGILHARPDLEFRTAPSLLVTAWGARAALEEGQVSVWYDAFRGEVFAATYELGRSSVRTVQPPARIAPATLVGGHAPPKLVVGFGAIEYRAEAAAWTGRDPLGPPEGVPKAGALLDLLGLDDATTRIEHPFDFEPDYGRRAEAQVRWEALHGRPLPDS